MSEFVGPTDAVKSFYNRLARLLIEFPPPRLDEDASVMGQLAR